MPDSLDAAEWFLKRALIAGVILLAIGLTIGLAATRWLAPAPIFPAPVAAPSGSISLRIDLPGDCRLSYTALSCSSGATVLDALNAAAAHAHPLHFEFQGSGDTAFLTRIESVANQAGGPSSRNWQFWLNDRIGTTGIGATILHPSDRITWVFEPYLENPRPPSP